MKRQMFLATAFSAALAVGVTAQTGTGARTGAQQGQRAQDEKQTVTVTGCLQQGAQASSGKETGGTGAPGAAGQRTSESQFILADARITSGASATSGSGTGSGTGTGTGAATSGTAGARGDMSLNRFQLTGQQDELRKYLNSQVEVRGTLEAPRGGAASPGAGTATGTGTGTGASRTGQDDDKNMRTLRVTSVKQIAKTCERK